MSLKVCEFLRYFLCQFLRYENGGIWIASISAPNCPIQDFFASKCSQRKITLVRADCATFRPHVSVFAFLGQENRRISRVTSHRFIHSDFCENCVKSSTRYKYSETQIIIEHCIPREFENGRRTIGKIHKKCILMIFDCLQLCSQLSDLRLLCSNLFVMKICTFLGAAASMLSPLVQPEIGVKPLCSLFQG